MALLVPLEVPLIQELPHAPCWSAPLQIVMALEFLALVTDGNTKNCVALLGVELVKFFPSVFDLCGMSMLHTAVQ